MAVFVCLFVICWSLFVSFSFFCIYILRFVGFWALRFVFGRLFWEVGGALLFFGQKGDDLMVMGFKNLIDHF